MRFDSATVAAWLGSRQAEMLDCLRAWVECESPSLEKARVDACGALVGAAFRGAGAQVTAHAQRGYGDALEITFPGCGPERAERLLLGHLDTVYAAGTLATMPWRVEGGRVYGPGVLDMKGGIVAALFAVRALQALEIPMRATRALLVGDEEVGSRESRPLTERLARVAEAVLVLEPATGLEGKLKTGRKGIALYTLTAHGRAAHAGIDIAAGASAITALAAQVVEVAGWTDIERGLTVNAGVIRGGTRSNVVAARAEVELDVRAWTAADLEAAAARLRALAPRDARVRLELGGGVNRPPMEPSPATAALFAQARQCGAPLGLTLEPSRTGGGSDGNFTAALGRPTLDGLGMVGEGAHAPHECLLLDQMARRTALLASLLARP